MKKLFKKISFAFNHGSNARNTVEEISLETATTPVDNCPFPQEIVDLFMDQLASQAKGPKQWDDRSEGNNLFQKTVECPSRTGLFSSLLVCRAFYRASRKHIFSDITLWCFLQSGSRVHKASARLHAILEANRDLVKSVQVLRLKFCSKEGEEGIPRGSLDSYESRTVRDKYLPLVLDILATSGQIRTLLVTGTGTVTQMRCFHKAGPKVRAALLAIRRCPSLRAMHLDDVGIIPLPLLAGARGEDSILDLSLGVGNIELAAYAFSSNKDSSNAKSPRTRANNPSHPLQQLQSLKVANCQAFLSSLTKLVTDGCTPELSFLKLRELTFLNVSPEQPWGAKGSPLARTFLLRRCHFLQTLSIIGCCHMSHHQIYETGIDLSLLPLLQTVRYRTAVGPGNFPSFLSCLCSVAGKPSTIKTLEIELFWFTEHPHGGVPGRDLATAIVYPRAAGGPWATLDDLIVVGSTFPELVTLKVDLILHYYLPGDYSRAQADGWTQGRIPGSRQLAQSFLPNAFWENKVQLDFSFRISSVD